MSQTIDLLENFRENLKSKGASPNTTKNYVSDLSTFVDFLKIENQYFSILTLPFVLNSEVLEKYKKWLMDSNPLTTANRRLSALRKFIDYVIENNLTSKDYTGTVSNLPRPNPLKPDDDIRNFNSFLNNDQNQSEQVDKYKNDIKYYLKQTIESISESENPSSKQFSIQSFLKWKTEKNGSSSSSDIPLISYSPKPKKNIWILLLGAFCLITLGIIFFAYVSFGPSRSIQGFDFLHTYPQKVIASFDGNKLQNIVMNFARPELVDPTAKRHDKFSVKKLIDDKISYIISGIFPEKLLLDPVNR